MRHRVVYGATDQAYPRRSRDRQDSLDVQVRKALVMESRRAQWARCLYRKLERGRSGGEVHLGWRAN